MKTRLKKTLSVLLTLCMILSVMSSSLIAVGASESAEPVSNDTVISDTESADGADTVTMPEGMTEGDPQTPPSDDPAANTEGEDSLVPTDPADSTDPAAPEDESDADTPEDEGIGMPGEEQNEDDVNNDVQAGENENNNDGIATIAETPNEQKGSSNLKGFLSDWGIYENDNLVYNGTTGVLSSELKKDVDYSLRFKFFALSADNRFKPATEEELRLAGVPDEWCEGGKYLYLSLGHNFSFDQVGDIFGPGARLVTNAAGETFLLLDYEEGAFSMNAKVSVKLGDGAESGGQVHAFEDEAFGTFTNTYTNPPSVVKTVSEFNPETLEIYYTVEITNDKNDSNNVIINDVTDYLQNHKDIELKDIVITGPNGPLNSPDDYEYKKSEGVIYFKNNNSLAPNQKFTITYKMDVSSLFGPNSTYNYVTNHLEVSSSSKDDVSLDKSFEAKSGSLSKSGNVIDEEDGTYIEWQIKVSAANGYKDGVYTYNFDNIEITDDLSAIGGLDALNRALSGLEVDSGTITVYKGNKSDGNVSAVTASYVIEGDKITITLHDPDGNTGESAVYLYLYTEAEEGKTYTNKVDSTFPDDKHENHSGYGNVTVPGTSGEDTNGLRVEKTIPDALNNDILRYTVYIYNIKKNDFTKLSIVDTLQDKWNSQNVFNFNNAITSLSVKRIGHNGEELKDYFNTRVAADGYSTEIYYDSPMEPDFLESMGDDGLISLVVTYEIDMKEVKTDRNGRYPDFDTLKEYWDKASGTLNNYAEVESVHGESDLALESSYSLSKSGTTIGTDTKGRAIIEYTVTFDDKGGVLEGLKTGNITLSDDFDDDLEYVAGTLECSFWDGDDDVRETLHFYYSPSNSDGAIKDGSFTVNFSDFKDDSGENLLDYFRAHHGKLTGARTYTFKYQLRSKSKVDVSKPRTFSNKASIEWNNKSIVDIGPIETNYTPDVLKKEAQLKNDGKNEVEFTVEVNNSCLDLVEGSNWLTVTDTFQSEYLDIDEDSISITARDANGAQREIGLRSEGKEYYYEVTISNGQMILMVPDQLALTIRYKFKLNSKAYKETETGEQVLNEEIIVTIDNRVKIDGKSEQTEGKVWSWSVKSISSGSVSAGEQISLKKLGKLGDGSTVNLKDAVFILYEENGKTNLDAWNQASLKTLPAKRSNVFNPIGVYTTNNLGELMAAFNAWPDTYFALVENSAPSGYVLLSQPIYFKTTLKEGTDSDFEITEIEAPDGVKFEKDGKGYYVLTVTDEKGEVTDVTVDKVWLDGGVNVNDTMIGDETGYPEVKVELMKSIVDGEVVGEAQGTGNFRYLNYKNNWTAKFTNLPVDDGAGHKIQYSVREVEAYICTGFDTAKNEKTTKELTGWEIGEAKETEPGIFTIENTKGDKETVDITVDKEWVVNGTQLIGDDIPDATVTVQLQRKAGEEGALEDVGKPVELKADSDTPWSYEFKDLPKADDEGVDYEYSVKETEITYKNGAVEAEWDTTYTDDISGESGTITVTNTKVEKKGKLTITKTVEGYSGTPQTYTFEITGPSGPQSVTIEGSGKVMVDDLIPGEYTVKETSSKLENFDMTVKVGDEESADATGTVTVVADDEANIEFTNEYKPKTTNLSVEKKWVDNSEADGVGTAPDGAEIVVQLLRDGIAVEGDDAKLIFNAEKGWSGSFENLPECDNTGHVYEYTIEVSENTTGWVLDVPESPDSNDKFVVTNTRELGSLELTKTVVGLEITEAKTFTFDVTGPESYTGVITITITKDDNGTGTGKLENLVPGEYTITERDAKVDGYTLKVEGEKTVKVEATQAGASVTNTYTAVKDITVTKQWFEKDGETKATVKLPNYITIVLKRNDGVEKTAVVIPDGTGNWSYTFKDLVKYDAAGNEYTYTVEEVEIEGWNSKVDGYTITNTREPISISGTKTWLEHDGKTTATDNLPDSIIVKLMDGEREVDHQEVKPVNGKWSYTFDNLDKYDDKGNEIKYTVVEEVPNGWTPSYDEDHNITNTRDVVSVSGIKKWVDKSDTTDKTLPKEVEITLYRNGDKYGESVKATKDNDWKYEFTDLPKADANGNDYKYTVDETAIPGWSKDVDGTTITNTREVIDIDVTKKWVENNGVTPAEDDLPQSVTVTLTGTVDGKPVVTKTATLMAPGYSHKFTNLPKCDVDGNEITYTVDETAIPGWTKAVNGYTITNTREVTSVTVTKLWKYSDDSAIPEDGIPNESVTVELYRNGVKYGESVKVTKGDNWTHTFTNLPKVAPDGNEYTYTVKETEGPEGWVFGDPAGSMAAGYTITNTKDVGSLTINKTVSGLTDDELKSATFTFEVTGPDGKTKTVTITGEDYVAGTKSVTLTGLVPGTYTVKETTGAVTGYEWTADVAANGVATVAKNATAEVNVTNKYTTSTELTVTKEWVDPSGEMSGKPDSVTEIEVSLIKDGEVAETVKLNAANNWTYTFKNLIKKDENGVTHTYSIRENTVIAGWTASYDGGKITNTRDVVSVSGTKNWVDNSKPADNTLPKEVEITLYRNGVKYGESVKATAADGWTYEFTNLPKTDATGKEYVYTVDETAIPGWTKAVTDYNITNTREVVSVSGTKTWVDASNGNKAPEGVEITVTLKQNGTAIDNKTLNAETGWTYEFANLPKIDAEGKDYVYTVDETAIPGWTKSITDYNITNTREVVSVSGTKTWVDASNDDKAPDTSITVQLLRDGEVIDSKTVTAADNWKYEFTNLPKTDAEGNDYKYTVDETAIPGWTKSITDYNITNTREVVSVSGTKTWVDASNDDKAPDTSITVQLLRDGEVIDSKTVTAADNWKYEFTNLPKTDAEGNAYTYTVDETAIPGWTKAVTGYNITNTREVVNVSGTKTWVDASNGNKAPETSITVQLLRDGEVIESKTVTAADNWKYEFTNLPKTDAEGNDYKYTVDETEIPGWTKAITGYNITNTREVVSVSGTKTWVDASNDNKALDTSITVQLLRNGEVIDSKTVTATDNWKYEFTNLPKTDADGNACTYTVDETAIPGWTKAINGYNITNTREVVNVSGTKTWVDASNDNKAPETSITVQLLRDGEVIDSKTVTSADNWKYEFTNLPKTDATGKEYVYTVDETAIPGWTKAVNGYNITNTREVVSVSGTKTWVDASNDNKAPETSITVQLLRDGEAIDSKTVTSADNWKYEFTNLPKTDATGKDYVYTVDETAIPGWTKAVNGYNITNTRTVVSVEGTKTWHSATGANTPVPDSYSVDVVVKNGETEVGRKTLSNANGWDYKFENLPEYDAAGNKIIYTVSEENAPEHWTSKVDGYNISNTMEGTEITANKTWNTRGLSVTVPESVTLKVLADGEDTGITIELSEANGWSATRGGLNKHDITDGHEIKYTVEEVPVIGWTPSYDGNSVTNTYDVTSVTAKKVWNKADGTPADAADEIPASVQVDVLADGVLRDTVTLMASNSWTSTLGNLPKYAEDGDEIEYTVKEHTVDGWVSAVTNDGNVYTVTNTKKVPEKGAITLTKQVIGGGAAAADKEYSFEINGPDGYSQTVTVTGAGSISLTDLEPGEYTVTEVGGRIGGYRLDVTGDNTTVTVEADGEANVVITNEYTELRDVEVTKEWYVNGSRTNAPAGASITVSLYADGVATGDSAILSQYTDWKAEFTGLDVYDEDGNEIRYTVAEVYVSGWTSTVVGTADTGFVIRNYSTYTPPHEPEQPDQPDEPEQPDEPDEPETPETPETPDIPHEPEQPRQPEQPREPERPFTPEMPETPEVPFYDIPDSEVPLTHITDSKTPLVDIPDLGVPLRALPATGDESHTVVWMAIMVCSAFGIIVLAAVLYFDGKKNKKREESAE